MDNVSKTETSCCYCLLSWSCSAFLCPAIVRPSAGAGQKVWVWAAWPDSTAYETSPGETQQSAPAWPLGQPELWAAVATLTSAPFSELGWKAGLNISAANFHCHCWSVTQRQTAVHEAWLSTWRLSASTSAATYGISHLSWHCICTQATQKCCPLVPDSAKVFVACIPIACHWKSASLVVGAWPKSWWSFCLTKDHGIGPRCPPSVHTLCCLGQGQSFLTAAQQICWSGFFSPITLISWHTDCFFPKLQAKDTVM